MKFDCLEMNYKSENFDKRTLVDWNKKFQKLVDYKEQFGHCDVPFLWHQDRELANWAIIQRNIQNKLPPSLKKMLVGLGFDFSKTTNTWEENFDALQRFAQDKGHVCLPMDGPEYIELRDWLFKQIQDKEFLPGERFNRLDTLGVFCGNVDLRSGRWLEMHGRLRKFRQEHGHCRVPQKWAQDPKLSNWVCVQRRMNASNKLSRERKSKLDVLGFVWNFKEVYDAHWEQNYQDLLAFHKEFGHCQIPGKYEKLASWAERQRTVKNNGKLSRDREKRLIDIGFVFNFKKSKEKAWQEKYLQLIEFKKEYDHSFVPVNWKANKILGCWVATQRCLEGKGKLDVVKKRMLDKLGFVWTEDTKEKLDAIYQSQWQESYRKLKAYNKKWGTCQVSLKIDPALQRWTSLQRRLYILDKLSPTRILKLDKLGFPWDINKAYWIKMYGALLRFHYSFGHTQVPWDKNSQLAAWVNRIKLNRHTLGSHKIKLLDAIGFDWEIKERANVPWEEMYGRLLEFKMTHGHTRVPVQWEEDVKLGKWASRMRYEKINLSWERIKLLNRISFDWGNKGIVVQQYRKSA